MKISKSKGFANIAIVIVVLVLLVIGSYFIINKNTTPVDTTNDTTNNTTNPVTRTSVSWTKDSITMLDNSTLSIDNIPDEIDVSKDASFGSSVAFTGAILSPDKRVIAISVTGGVHEFGWIYEISKEKLTPVAFSFDGGVVVKRWNNNDEVVFDITSPKPETKEVVINIKKLSEYPKIHIPTGAQIRDEMSKNGCPDQLIVNKMPGPGSQVKSSYYVKDGKRVEVAEFDPIWLKANCDVPTEEVF